MERKDMIPYEEGVIPPHGYVLAQTTSGERFWISPSAVNRSPVHQSALTDDQVRRIKDFKEILGKSDSASLDQTLDNFSRDQNPENEIRVFERIARIYQMELSERSEADEAEQVLLYRVVLTCSWSADLDQVLAVLPTAKRLPDLERVAQRYFNT